MRRRSGSPRATLEDVKRPAVPALVIAVAALLVGLLTYGLVAGGTDTTLDDAVARGDRPAAPEATRELPLNDGSGTRSLADERGKIVVLNFWASWCEPCKDEAPVLEKIHRRLSDAGKGMVLGALFDDAIADARAFEREFGLTYPSMRDVDSELYKGFGGTGVPETFVLDPAGRVTAVSRGQVSEAFLDEALRKLGA
ncbi:redoxin domain-containing protein [Conexibacter sp. W3-3-2]|uniref:Thiol:disulfide interchange protein n=1 Tax=Paraconexibacter algicola TaxID=2133960 RepID=A0A2T4UE61_9ACTN|nr:redoxin domain-containing protein [Conexibacter sp. W3-3-2]PTL55702.1 thiol:disulfide interchange protein [Paraconexibacter algicola]